MSDAPLLLTFYGDDLTGSTDVMEALALRGVETALFLEVPTPDRVARFANLRAVGIAGTSRSESPAWMDANLPAAFRWMAAQDAEIAHYKVCSTFDSSSAVGSIGRAMELGRDVFGGRPVPLLVGAPQLKRYTAFGELFAAYRGETYRIDRHPLMSRHPVTPMREADLRRHLAAQTDLRIALVDAPTLLGQGGDQALDAVLREGPDAVLLDVLDLATQRAAGRQLRRMRAAGSRFAIGSSGVEYALAADWESSGDIPGRAAFPPLPATERIAVVSGSCSPTTERQIRHALDQDFIGLPLDPLAFVNGDTAAVDLVLSEALAQLRAGRSVVIHTALGPGDDLGSQFGDSPDARHRIVRGLGRVQARLVREVGLSRSVVAGGDTSSHALREMGVFALTPRLPLPDTPGSPVCRAWSDEAAFDGLEIAFKGGQIGNDDYFVRLRDGLG